MRVFPSLQKKLSIGAAIAIVLLWLIATLISGLVMRHELDETLDSALQEAAQRILSIALTELNNSDVSDRPGLLIKGDQKKFQQEFPDEHIMTPQKNTERLTYVVRDYEGKVLIESQEADRAVFPEVPVPGFSDTSTHIIYTERGRAREVYIQMAEPLYHRREAVLGPVVVLLFPLPFLIPLSFFGVWWFIQTSLRPLQSVRREIGFRGAGDLSRLSDKGLTLELKPIVGAVNQLMQRLQTTLNAERSFTANSAHELRTPLAGALAQTQLLISATPPGELRDRAFHVEESLRKLTRLSEKLMQLASADRGNLNNDESIDLVPVLLQVMDEYRSHSRDSVQLQFIDSGRASLVSTLDADAFAILMRNLIDNALIHNPDESVIVVKLVLDNTVSVLNGGQIVSPDKIELLLNRFERGDTTASGTGLGLAIVDAIVKSSNAKFKMFSPARGRSNGFEAVLTLP